VNNGASATRTEGGTAKADQRTAPDRRHAEIAGAGSVNGVLPWSLEETRNYFRKWLGKSYDTDVSDAVLAVLAAAKLSGDPLWLLIVSGPGDAKTEMLRATEGAGAIVISTISSEAALLSGTARKERAKDATGGLLRRLKDGDVLAAKDFTTILSMDRTAQAAVLAALREVYDGQWVRNVGADGGRTLEWKGRIGFIGACTTAWDSHHGVVAKMGDRFVVIRPRNDDREAVGRQAMANTGREELMREGLRQAVAHALAGMKPNFNPELRDTETDALLQAANVVTLARTAVETDFKGNLIDAHAPEKPTRFAKQLTQLMRGSLALGMARSEALSLALRCARDSMPPLRLACLLDVAAHPDAGTSEVRRRLDKPYTTIDRQLQTLHLLTVLTCRESPSPNGKTIWRYSVAAGLKPDLLIHRECGDRESGRDKREDNAPSHISGESDYTAAERAGMQEVA
jgi:hypothetical protein